MVETFKCPTCGAPVQGDRCIFCGTVFIDWTTDNEEKANYIKIRREYDGHIILMKAHPRRVGERLELPIKTYLNHIDYYYLKNPEVMFIDATLECLPFQPVGIDQEVCYIDITESNAQEDTNET